MGRLSKRERGKKSGGGGKGFREVRSHHIKIHIYTVTMYIEGAHTCDSTAKETGYIKSQSESLFGAVTHSNNLLHTAYTMNSTASLLCNNSHIATHRETSASRET